MPTKSQKFKKELAIPKEHAAQVERNIRTLKVRCR